MAQNAPWKFHWFLRVAVAADQRLSAFVSVFLTSTSISLASFGGGSEFYQAIDCNANCPQVGGCPAARVIGGSVKQKSPAIE